MSFPARVPVAQKLVTLLTSPYLGTIMAYEDRDVKATRLPLPPGQIDRTQKALRRSLSKGLSISTLQLGY